MQHSCRPGTRSHSRRSPVAPIPCRRPHLCCHRPGRRFRCIRAHHECRRLHMARCTSHWNKSPAHRCRSCPIRGKSLSSSRRNERPGPHRTTGRRERSTCWCRRKRKLRRRRPSQARMAPGFATRCTRPHRCSRRPERSCQCRPGCHEGMRLGTGSSTGRWNTCLARR